MTQLLTTRSGNGGGGQSSFDPSKFHTIFFNPGNATSIEFTTKSLYEGSRYGRLPKYTLGGVEMNTWYEDSELTQQVLSTTIFNKTNDIELFNSITPDIPDNPDNPGTGDTGGTVNASPLCFTSKEANSTVELNQMQNLAGDNEYVPTLEYKLEGTTTQDWTRYTIGQTITLANVDDKMYMRATSEGNQTISDKNFGLGLGHTYQFSMTGKIAASGNIQTLLDQTGKRMDVPAYCYQLLFKSCRSLIQAPELPASILTLQCYQQMFYLCENLTSAPELPATTLGTDCYIDMFDHCPLFSTVKMKASMNGVYNKSTHGAIGKTVEYVL